MTDPLQEIWQEQALNIRQFRRAMHARIDAEKTVPIKRNESLVGFYVPLSQYVPPPPAEPDDESEPEPDFDLDEDPYAPGPVVIARITGDAGPRWNTLWTSSNLTLPEFLGEID